MSLRQQCYQSTFHAFLFCRISHSPGLTAEHSVHWFTTSSPTHSTTNPWGQSHLQTDGKTLNWLLPPERNSPEFLTSWLQRTCPAWWRREDLILRWCSPTSRRSTGCATNCRQSSQIPDKMESTLIQVKMIPDSEQHGGWLIKATINYPFKD